mgnify:CR=1 FL=1
MVCLLVAIFSSYKLLAVPDLKPGDIAQVNVIAPRDAKVIDTTDLKEKKQGLVRRVCTKHGHKHLARPSSAPFRSCGIACVALALNLSRGGQLGPGLALPSSFVHHSTARSSLFATPWPFA